MSRVRHHRSLQSRRDEPHRRSSLGSVRSVLIAAVAHLCLLTQAAVLGHLSIVPHSTCLEHGTVVHESSHEHAASELAPSEGKAATEIGVAQDTHALLDDQHCAVAGLHNAPMPQVLEAGSAGLMLQMLGSSAPSTPETTSAPARYRVAPKNSPPRA